jgi:Na+/H+-translocating membrane pyrophosphatase
MPTMIIGRSFCVLTTMIDEVLIVQAVICAYVCIAAAAVVIVVECEEPDEVKQDLQEKVRRTQAKIAILKSLKRKLDMNAAAQEENENKKSKKLYNYERAKICIMED